MSEHAKLSPSGSSRWIACPGSPRLCAGIPDTSSAAAELGTAAHELGADCLTGDRDAAEYAGILYGKFTVDDEMAEAVQEYLDVVRELLDTVEDGHLHVIDYKHGAGVFVEIDMNPQLLIYALGALLMIEEVWPKGYAQLLVEHRVDVTEDVWGTADAIVIGRGKIHTVHYHIVQPRHRLGGHHTREISARLLCTWRDDFLLPAIAATEEPDAELHPGEHCRFCDAKPTCPELRSQALATARDVFDGDPAELVTRGDVDVSAMPPAEIAKALVAFPIVEQWMKAVRDHAYTLARGGTEIPGHKVVDVVGHRKWDDEWFVEIMCEIEGIDPYAPRKLLSPAAAVKLLPKGRKKALDSLASKPVSGASLVLDSDKRPARNAADVFDTIEDITQ